MANVLDGLALKEFFTVSGQVGYENSSITIDPNTNIITSLDQVSSRDLSAILNAYSTDNTTPVPSEITLNGQLYFLSAILKRLQEAGLLLTYQNNVNYALNATMLFNGIEYRSLINNNLNSQIEIGTSWDLSTSYSINDTAFDIFNNIYRSKTDNNLNNDLTDNGHWEMIWQNSNPSSEEVGDYIFSTLDSKAGFFLCDGSEISRTIYSNLFALIGDSFGIGDGSTTFNLPDFRGKVFGAIGQGLGLTNRSLGNLVGEEEHQLTEPEMPAHKHIEDNPPLIPNIFTGGSSSPAQGYQTPGVGSATAPILSNGGDQPHNNMQPTLFAGNVFIKY